MIEYVIKRDGRKEPFDPEKLNGWAQWAEKTINSKDFNWSTIVMRAIAGQPKKIHAKDLQEALVRECLNQNSWEGSRMAGRLYASMLPKELYKNRVHPTIKDLHSMLIRKGVIVKPNYTDEEYEQINKMINHKRDFTYSHYAINQLVSKYSLRDRLKKKPYETPQFSYMRVAMQALNDYTAEDRMERLKELYDEMSLQRVVVPTPYFANSLTSNPSTASCSVIACTDEAESIGVLNTLAYTLTTAGAGVGAHMKTRSLGDAVRGGLIKHAGKVPYYRAFANVMKSSTQGCYDPETEILTKEGWKFFKDLTEEDYVAQVTDDVLVKYVKPTEYFRYTHKGKMYLFEGEGINLLVTPNHRIITFDDKTFGECTAEEYSGQIMLYFDYEDQLQSCSASVEVIENYEGEVFCVTVPSGRLIVKRNNKMTVCGNSRSGAATMYFPFFDPEVEVLAGLKNPLSTVANRVRDSDYAVSVNKPFIKRALTKKPTWLFSYKDNPELYEKFYHADSETFDRELEEFAKAHPNKVKEVNAQELLTVFMKHRVETGRLYIHFADISNYHTPYTETIYSSNLCVEISLPTKPFKSHLDLYSDNPEGLVAFCNLAGINLINIKNDEEYEKAAYYALFLIDKGIDNSTFIFPALNANLKQYRSAGVGVNGLAYLMAKNGLSYSSQEGRDFIFEMAEKHGYFLTKAAIKLTEEFGVCEKAHLTKYSQGWIPFDSAPEASKQLSTKGLSYDWEPLREAMKTLGGLRFTTLSCLMPAESSSIAVSSTNSIYPVRDLSLIKSSGDTTNKWFAPDATKYSKKYEIVWDVPNEDLIKTYAIYQIFIDQSISGDTFLDRSKVVNVSMADMFKELALCAKYGVKTLYYLNSLTDKKETFDFLKGGDEEELPPDANMDGCGSGGCTL